MCSNKRSIKTTTLSRLNTWLPEGAFVHSRINELKKKVMKNAKVIEVGKKLLEAGISLELEWNKDYPAIRHGMYKGNDGYYFRMRGRNDFNSEEKKTTTNILNEYGFKVVDFSPFEIEWGGDRYYNASVSFMEKPEDLAVGSLKRLWDI